MSKFVYSTATASIMYREYEPGGGDVKKVKKELLIQGGSNIALRNKPTALGVLTVISDDDYEWLKNDKAFQRHVDRKFMRVMDSKVDPEVAAGKMALRDQSAQARPEDFTANDGETAPKIVAPSKKAEKKAE